MGSSTDVAVIIPFRDRGSDQLRGANLKRVLRHWDGFADIIIVDDGRSGDAQFNRSAAYNRGTALTASGVIVYTESDMLIDHQQIREAIDLAVAKPGLVVPFRTYHYLNPSDSADVRDTLLDPDACIAEFVRDGGASVGAINVVSRETLKAIGQWDEAFEGNWHDDIAMKIAFELCAGPTRWVTGPAYHIWHKPGWAGEHLTAEDKAATEANKARLALYERAETADEIRELTMGVHA